MTRIVPVALALSLWFGAALSAQQAGHAAIRASIELEAARLASSLAAADQTRDGSTAVSVRADQITKERLDERVRITASDGRKIVGWIDRIDEQTITLTQQRWAAATIPLNAITRIERPNGKRSRFGPAALGLIVGLVAGNRLGALSAKGCRPAPRVAATGPGGDMFYGLDCAIDASISIVMGTAAGGVVGTVVGALLPNQKWTTVPQSSLVSVLPTPP